MARSKYSEEERDKILVSFIVATREVILIDGIEKVTVRRIADSVGCNSAKLYFYFKDLDQLVTMACLGYLERYTQTLVSDFDEISDNYQLFFHTWEVFSYFAFSNPSVYNQIFFKNHEVELNEMISEYYRLFPQQFDKISEPVKKMLFAGTILDRNRAILMPLVEDGIIRSDNIELINELMHHYFHSLLLERARTEGGMLEMERSKKRFMNCLEYLINNEKI